MYIQLLFANLLKQIIVHFSPPVAASADVGFAIWNRYAQKDPTPPIGYTAHLTGALAGLTIGLAILKNFQQKLHQQYMCWVALAVYLGCVGFAIFWNVFYY